jgi:hypothetical protein
MSKVTSLIRWRHAPPQELADGLSSARCLSSRSCNRGANACEAGSRTLRRRRATLRSRSCYFAPGVKERRKPPETSPEKSRRRRPRQPAATSLLNDVRPPARRLTGANAHRLLSCESELRVRSCVFPPDLRVSGARQRILRPSTSVETSRSKVPSKGLVLPHRRRRALPRA